MTDVPTLSQSIAETLKERGPLLGKDLVALNPTVKTLKLWQACFTSDDIRSSHFSRYYLRYDITREDIIRLSPSILRDFLSFTLLSTHGQRQQVFDTKVTLSNHHRKVSMAKMRIARAILRQVMKGIPLEMHHQLCAFIAGDIAYFLAHTEPRELASIGEMVNGSDIDIIIVHDGLPEEYLTFIDQEIMSCKNYYLRHPDYREEVDYICKSKDTMFEQLAYTDIDNKIASKIAYESQFLAGSIELFSQIKDEVDNRGTRDLIERDFRNALEQRKNAMRTLLNADSNQIDKNTESLFYFSQERVEFR